MAHIFLSYAREDRERAKVLAKALEDHGWTVWWDPQIPPGKTFVEVIKSALEEAKCAVVLWSKYSVKSEWVQEEAIIAKRRGILVPAKLDDIDPPLGFGLVQSADLKNWEGEKTHPDFAGLVGAISDIIGLPFSDELVGTETEISAPKTETVKPTEDKLVSEQQPVSAVPLRIDGESEFGPLSVTVEKPVLKRRYGIAIGIAALVLLAVGIFLVNYSKKPNYAQNITNSIGMEFVLIPKGSFMMGSDSKVGYDNERPSHAVNISRPFYLQKTEVTQGEWKEVIDENLSCFHVYGDDYPVEWVSWDDAQKFIEKLNQLEGTDLYRLPTEAEWEYACRAGATTEFSFGDDAVKLKEYAWYEENSNRHSHPVGQNKPNVWGLFDMHGNVWEWCQDWYAVDYYKNSQEINPQGPETGSDRVLRGGGWSSHARGCRSANRQGYPQGTTLCNIGFRLAKSVAPGP